MPTPRRSKSRSSKRPKKTVANESPLKYMDCATYFRLHNLMPPPHGKPTLPGLIPISKIEHAVKVSERTQPSTSKSAILAVSSKATATVVTESGICAKKSASVPSTSTSATNTASSSIVKNTEDIKTCSKDDETDSKMQMDDSGTED